MKIVQICPCPFPSLGGPAKTFQQFHEAVELETIAFVRPSDGRGEKAVVPIAVTVRTRDWPGVGHYYSASACELKKAEVLVAQADCVFIHNFFLFPSIWTMRACRRHRVPYVIVLHGILDPWALRKSRVVKWLWLAWSGRQVLRHAAAVLCATQREREKAGMFFTDGQAHVVSWPCEIPDGAAVRLQRPRLRQQLGFSERDRVLIFLGRLHSMKRPVETVRLLAGLNEPRLKLLVVGPDWDVTRLLLEAEARRLRWDGLRVVGPVFGAGKFDYLGAADGYISLSHRENFNYTLAEAMGAGLPPILSAGNDLGWEFSEAGFSWQLRSYAPEEAAAAVREFLAVPDTELSRRGAAAREWVQLNLGSARFAGELQRVIRRVAPPIE